MFERKLSSCVMGFKYTPARNGNDFYVETFYDLMANNMC